MAATRRTKAKSKVDQRITIEPLKLSRITVIVIGRQGSSLVLHNWDEKAKKQMRDKQQKKTKLKERPVRDPDAEYEGAFYRLPNGAPAIKAVSFKLAMGSYAATLAEGVTQTFIKKVISIPGHVDAPDLLEVHGNPKKVEDTVRLSGIGNPSDLRYRPYFDEWWVEVPIEFDDRHIKSDDVVNLLDWAGHACGVGDFRNEKSGHNYGRFFVANDKEVKAIKKRIPVKRYQRKKKAA